jgi:N-acetylglucosamine kinase-like BadF-type ATPase
MSQLFSTPITAKVESPPTESLFLAIDGGGTRTRALVANAHGHTLGTGLSGPTNLTATSVGAAVYNLKEAVRQALQFSSLSTQQIGFTRVAMGLAGVDTPQELESATKLFRETLASSHRVDDFLLVNDTVVALRSGSSAPNRFVIIAGTGSNCFGQNEKGQEAKAGGWDFLLSDEGSGYAIGLATLRAAVMSADGRAPKTALERLVFQHFRIHELNQLKRVVYQPLLNKSQIAEVSKVCFEAFEEGDAMASSILNQAVEDLALMAYSVMEKLGFRSGAVECVVTGGILQSEWVKKELLQHLRAFNPEVKLIQPHHPPVWGALQLALNGH